MEPLTNLGQLLDADAKRDAIHIAVAPVIADHYLKPGQHIGLLEQGSEIASSDSTHIGIVDPFLKTPVRKGQRFWMFLYPNTIQSLRHEWAHPAFGGAEHISRDDHITKSRKWIEQHAKALGLSDDVLMSDAEYWLEYEDYKVQQGSERWRDTFEADEFWHHYEVVTGKIVPQNKKQSFYCCTC